MFRLTRFGCSTCRSPESGSTYTCTYGTEAPTVYTIDLTAIDGDFVYAGLFTARQAQISFSNISFTVTN